MQHPNVPHSFPATVFKITSCFVIWDNPALTTGTSTSGKNNTNFGILFSSGSHLASAISDAVVLREDRKLVVPPCWKGGRRKPRRCWVAALHRNSRSRRGNATFVYNRGNQGGKWWHMPCKCPVLEQVCDEARKPFNLISIGQQNTLKT